ncbi:unnamed protein product [Closterium sp. NIES-64]|nr:unnamed protein product [Closterium sp. NIES-64]
MWGRGGPGQAQHVLRMAARRTAQQERGDGYVATIEVDGHPMPKLVLGDELSLFDGAATILLAAYEKQGPYDVDVYAIKVPGVIEAEVRVRRVHPLLQEPDDAEAHINLAILDVAYSPTVHGLLGQFYRANATSEPTLNYSILSHLMAMPLVPSESSSEGELEGVPEDYVTSSLLAPDCEFTQFSLFSKKTTSNGDADLSNSGSNNAGTDSSSSSRMTETTSSEIIIRGEGDDLEADYSGVQVEDTAAEAAEMALGEADMTESILSKAAEMANQVADAAAAVNSEETTLKLSQVGPADNEQRTAF